MMFLDLLNISGCSLLNKAKVKMFSLFSPLIVEEAAEPGSPQASGDVSQRLNIVSSNHPVTHGALILTDRLFVWFLGTEDHIGLFRTRRFTVSLWTECEGLNPIKLFGKERNRRRGVRGERAALQRRQL